ncbi:hypothetical protein HK414_12765 [Ramlibacter terrae]|uniref:Uncharacterized protein n=1 Tax=Ramlibacter terrae TaxID=2732511 RepID=A0ABX6P4I9_9BURK|nr:hypothetical protein HK414_12765 [Ramlibacter terrae]
MAIALATARLQGRHLAELVQLGGAQLTGVGPETGTLFRERRAEVLLGGGGPVLPRLDDAAGADGVQLHVGGDHHQLRSGGARGEAGRGLARGLLGLRGAGREQGAQQRGDEDA